MNAVAEPVKHSEIPTVAGLPLLGNTLGMARDPAQFFLACYRKYGPVFRVSVAGNRYVVIAGAEAANFMGTREGRECLRSKEFWQGLVKEFNATCVLPGTDGEQHKQLRDIMRRGYGRDAIRGRFMEVVGITDHGLERDWPVGALVPVVQNMQYLVLDQLGTLLTDMAPQEYMHDIRTVILYILNVLVTRQRPKFMLKFPEYRKAKARMAELGERMVKRGHERYGKIPDDKRVLTDDIMRAHVEHPEIIPAQDLLLTLTGPYVAGLDTVANTEAAIVYCVLKHPDVQRRVIAEVDAVFGHGELDEAEFMRSTPNLQGAVMEAMRLYPIAVAQMRTANKDFEFAGYSIHEGEMMYVATSVPHFMEEYYPEPRKFDIDRYQKPRSEHLKPGVYSPYGRGPHTCLGKSLAEVQLALTIGRLFHKLDLELETPDYVLKTKTAPTPGPAMSFKVRVVGKRH